MHVKDKLTSEKGHKESCSLDMWGTEWNNPILSSKSDKDVATNAVTKSKSTGIRHIDSSSCWLCNLVQVVQPFKNLNLVIYKMERITLPTLCDYFEDYM